MGVPVVATHHNWTRENALVGTYEFLDAFYLRFFDRIIAVSDAVRQSMLSFGIKSRLISVIPNGINLEQFTPSRGRNGHLRRALGIDERARVIGAVGRLSPEKGFTVFLHAAKKILTELPQTWFLIVGDGPLKSQLSQYAKGLGIEDRVVFTGFHTNIADIYSAMDVYVLSSLREGTPMALLEAMAMKLPAVATDVGGVSRILRHNHNGVLLSSPDARTISEAVLWLLNNPSESARLGHAARTTVTDEFSAHRMAHDYEQVYSDILDLSRRQT
jgi:glycosyltransferase involved in cell wall biosynthesis